MASRIRAGARKSGVSEAAAIARDRARAIEAQGQGEGVLGEVAVQEGEGHGEVLPLVDVLMREDEGHGEEPVPEVLVSEGEGHDDEPVPVVVAVEAEGHAEDHKVEARVAEGEGHATRAILEVLPTTQSQGQAEMVAAVPKAVEAEGHGEVLPRTDVLVAEGIGAGATHALEIAPKEGEGAGEALGTQDVLTTAVEGHEGKSVVESLVSEGEGGAEVVASTVVDVEAEGHEQAVVVDPITVPQSEGHAAVAIPIPVVNESMGQQEVLGPSEVLAKESEGHAESIILIGEHVATSDATEQDAQNQGSGVELLQRYSPFETSYLQFLLPFTRYVGRAFTTNPADEARTIPATLAHWSCDTADSSGTTLLDLSGHGFTLQGKNSGGNSLTLVTGLTGDAVRLGSAVSSAFLEQSGGSGGFPIVPSWSLHLAFKTTGTGRIIGMANDDSFGGGLDNWYLSIAGDGKVTFGVRSNATTHTMASAASKNDGNWHRCVLRFRRDTVGLESFYAELHVDGTLEATSALIARDTIGAHTFFIGKTGAGTLFTGTLDLDEIRVLSGQSTASVLDDAVQNPYQTYTRERTITAASLKTTLAPAQGGESRFDIQYFYHPDDTFRPEVDFATQRPNYPTADSTSWVFGDQQLGAGVRDGTIALNSEILTAINDHWDNGYISIAIVPRTTPPGGTPVNRHHSREATTASNRPVIIVTVSNL